MKGYNLFNLTKEELALTNQLQDIICTEIDNSGGSISFSRYMELALYHKDFGYYNNLLFKFGQSGDFTTAPLVSNLFAKCLSRQINQLFEHTDYQCILEIGSGNGQLMLDILSEIGDNIKYYYILEISGNLSNLQKNRLINELPQYSHKVKWLTGLPDNFIGVVLANEVLDAQPCEAYVFEDGTFYTREVTHSNYQLHYINKVINNNDLDYLEQLPLNLGNCILDINLNNRGFIKSIAQCLDKGCVILIDYGYGQNEFYSTNHLDGTVRGFFRQHKLDDVLIYPGLIDITSNVNFTSIVESGIINGLDVIDYTSQGAFLLNCGLLDYVSDIDDVEKQLRLSNQVNKLTSPNEMGQIFKVIGFSKGIDFSDWIGFNAFSLSHLL